MPKTSLQWLAIGLHPRQSAAAALRLHQGPKKIHEGHAGKKSYPRRATKDDEGPLRGWRRLERGLPRIAKRRKNFHEKAKRYPRRATKNGEGPLRGWRRPERNPPKVGKGVHEGTPRVGKDSKGVREGPRRKTLRGKRFPPRGRKTLPVCTPITPPLRGSRQDQGAARGRAGGGLPRLIIYREPFAKFRRKREFLR